MESLRLSPMTPNKDLINYSFCFSQKWDLKPGNQESFSHLPDRPRHPLKGEQNRPPPQNAPLWHMDYFEPKVIQTHLTQEKLLPLLYRLKIYTNISNRLGAWPRKITMTRDNLLSERLTGMAGQTSAPISLWMALPPFEAPSSCPIPKLRVT